MGNCANCGWIPENCLCEETAKVEDRAPSEGAATERGWKWTCTCGATASRPYYTEEFLSKYSNTAHQESYGGRMCGGTVTVSKLENENPTVSEYVERMKQLKAENELLQGQLGYETAIGKAFSSGLSGRLDELEKESSRWKAKYEEAIEDVREWREQYDHAHDMWSKLYDRAEDYECPDCDACLVDCECAPLKDSGRVAQEVLPTRWSEPVQVSPIFSVSHKIGTYGEEELQPVSGTYVDDKVQADWAAKFFEVAPYTRKAPEPKPLANCAYVTEPKPVPRVVVDLKAAEQGSFVGLDRSPPKSRSGYEQSQPSAVAKATSYHPKKAITICYSEED